MPETILLTGGNGQLGSELRVALTEKFGRNQVVVTDLNPPGAGFGGIFEPLDATDPAALTALVRQYGVSQIYHLAAVLSARGEAHPLRTWEINMQALLNVLEIARQEQVGKVFYPSSIAVFGPGAPLDDTPNDTVLDPTTVYGISKAAGENWAQYYWSRYGLDVRSLRYPGIIGYGAKPGGGTTDYAVEIYHAAVAGQPFSCFLDAEERLPMIYMEDAIRATLELMDAPTEAVKIRTSYNLSGLSFSPRDIAAAIQDEVPGFRVSYAPDHRQAIAASWPNSIDDSRARADWGWRPRFDTLPTLTQDMLLHLRSRQTNNSGQEDGRPYVVA